MKRIDFIQKYFQHSKDKVLDAQFRKEAGFFYYGNCIYSLETIDRDQVRVSFKDIMKFRDQAIIENGIRIGIATLAVPHTIQIRAGSFICSGVQTIEQKKVNNKWRKIDVSVSKGFCSNKINLKIDNNHVSAKIVCDFIYPESYFSEIRHNI